MALPRTIVSTVAMMPIASEGRAPQISRSSTDRPAWSVPSGKLAEGGASEGPGALTTSRSLAWMNSGAASASTVTATRTPSPIIALGRAANARANLRSATSRGGAAAAAGALAGRGHVRRTRGSRKR